MSQPAVILSELVALRARMSRGRYLINHADAGESIARIGVRTYGGVEEPLTVASAFGTENDVANVAGLVATHNAAPALIEFALATLELEELRTRARLAERLVLNDARHMEQRAIKIADVGVEHTYANDDVRRADFAARTAIAEALWAAKDRYDRARKAIL